MIDPGGGPNPMLPLRRYDNRGIEEPIVYFGDFETGTVEWHSGRQTVSRTYCCQRTHTGEQRIC